MKWVWTAGLWILEIMREKILEWPEITGIDKIWNQKLSFQILNIYFQLKETLNSSKSTDDITTVHNHCHFLWFWVSCGLKKTIWDPNITDTFPTLQMKSSPSEVSDKNPCDFLHISKSILVKLRQEMGKLVASLVTVSSKVLHCFLIPAPIYFLGNIIY